MLFAVPAEEYRVDEDVERALNLLLILHADHEQNLQHFNGAAGGQQQSKYVCVHRGGHLRPVGAAAWRRQSGSHGDAAIDP